MRRVLLHGAFLVALMGLPLGACAPEARVQLEGEAMGTRWHVTLLDGPPTRWRARIEEVLARIDTELSTWRDDSELARFNAYRGGDWFPVSTETARVAREALDVHRRTGGAFDPSVAPLVALWGFGPAGPMPLPPPPAALAVARARVDASRLEVRGDPPALRKRAPDLELDLSAIAKGRGVDAVAERLVALGASRFLVEIGGELRCQGAGPHDGAWRIAIERPRPAETAPERVLSLRDVAVATSGTYRNFATLEGERRPHVIDPRSGEPIRHDLVSVSVIAATTSRADGFATGLLVLGPEQGPALAEREGLAALFVIERGGRLVEEHTPALAPYLPSAGEEIP